MAVTHHDDIEVVAGDDWEIDGTLLDVNDNPVDLTNAFIQWIFIGPDGLINQSLITAATIVISDPPTAGQITVKIPAAVTEMDPGRCFDGCRLLSANGVTASQWVGQIIVDADPFAQLAMFQPTPGPSPPRPTLPEFIFGANDLTPLVPAIPMPSIGQLFGSSNLTPSVPVITAPSVAAGIGLLAANLAPSTPVIIAPSISMNPVWARVQGVLVTAGGATTTNLSFPVTITNGNVVVGAVLTQTDKRLISITDDKANAYNLVNSSADATPTLTVTGFISAAPITNGAKTLTFTYQSATIFWALIEEFGAGFPLQSVSVDGSQVMATSGLLSTAVFQTLKSNDLLWSAAFSTANTTHGAGWTVGLGDVTSQLSEWKLGGPPNNSNAATWAAQTGSNWATVFGVSATPRTSWAFRQNQIQRSANNTTTGSISFAKPVSNGSIIIGSLAIATGTGNHIADVTSLTDDKGNSYSIISPNVNGRAIFWSNGPITNGPTTITCTTSLTEAVIYFMVNEFIPPPGTSTFAVDGTPVISAPGSGTTFSSGTVTTTHNGDLIYGFTDSNGSGSQPTNGFSTLNGQFNTWSDAYLIQQSAGAVFASWIAGAGGSNAIGLVAISAN